MRSEYNYFLFLIIVILVSSMLHLLMPFPYYVMIPLFVIVIVPVLFRRMVIKKFNLDGNHARVVFSCVICGNEHNDESCPRCGSKMKRGKF